MAKESIESMDVRLQGWTIGLIGLEGWIEWRALSASAEGNLGKPAIHTEEGWRIEWRAYSVRF
jgi:hypothetical protein